jgi:putative membrane protein
VSQHVEEGTDEGEMTRLRPDREHWRSRAPGLFARGVAMGSADVVPGVSGGTMALITGIYDELVGTIAGIDQHLLTALLRGRFGEVWQRANLGFLLPLLTGIFGAIITLAKGITWLLEHHPTPSWGALTGLIIASLLVVARQVDRWTAAAAGAVVVGALAGYGVTLLVPVQTGLEWYKFTGAGMVASVAMILPGISGSFLLVVMGKYQQILAAVNARDLAVIAFFGVGFAGGILGFSRVLRWLLARAHALTMAFLVGLMAGSVRKVWPYKEFVGDEDGPFRCVLPAEWGGEAWLTFGLMLAAGVAVLLIERAAGGLARTTHD